MLPVHSSTSEYLATYGYQQEQNFPYVQSNKNRHLYSYQAK